MFQNTYWIVISLVPLVIFSIVLLLSHEESVIENPCKTFSAPCVRICCNDYKTCKDDYLRENFNKSYSEKMENVYENETPKELHVLHGRPLCATEISKDDWYFTHYDGGIEIGGQFYNNDKYCFEDVKVDGEVQWNLYICASKIKLQKVVHIILSSVSALTSMAVVIIYFAIKSFRTLHGKIVMMFCFAMALSYFFYAFITKDTFYYYHMPCFLYTLLLHFAFQWTSIMGFDIFFTLRNLNASSEGRERFLYYCGYATFSLFVTFCLIYESFYLHTIKEYIFLLSLVLDIIFFILAGVKIFQMSKSSRPLEHTKLEEEKSRYWMYLSAFAIIIFNIVIEPFDIFRSDVLLDDMIRCYCAILLFPIFVLQKNVWEKFS
ncbi:CLUMA_CG018050, isoform A [Clunio marinus]|uniref:CLUMA_CG018050, isoform A n=1 Tax=Clunio marinus TaxID=568069 RepID=A0A1J1J0V2_9DIPT|nr:CLUMA_CG018050, isoform A [Clunio marinus]